MAIPKKLKNWIPAIIMMALIFMASATPGQVLRSVGFTKESYHVDAHFLFFFLLCVGYYKAVKNPALAWFLTFLYALSDEFHQRFVPLRSSSLEDVLVAYAAGLAVVLILWVLPKKLKNWLND